MKKLIPFCLLFFVSELSAQTMYRNPEIIPQRNQVTAINSLTLYKKQWTWQGNENEGSKTLVDFIEHGGEYVFVYYDSRGRIRKFISAYNYPEECSYMLCYYDDNGDLIFLNSYCHSAMNYAVNGSAYMKKGSLAYLDVEVYDEEDKLKKTIVQHQGKFPLSYDIKSKFGKYLHTDSLKAFDGEEVVFKAEQYKKVKFNLPRKGDITLTNAKRVNLRKLPSTEASILTVVKIGTLVQIVADSEKDWYKVKVGNLEGYIYGDMLEAVEKNLSELK